MNANSPLLVNLDCGLYRANGYMEYNVQNQFIFSINKNSSTPVELLVVGGDPLLKLNYLHIKSDFEFYVPQKIIDTTSSSTSVVFHSILLSSTFASPTKPKLLQRAPCGLDHVPH